jgi:hypothetical protein
LYQIVEAGPGLPHEHNLCVGPTCSILEISSIFLRLNQSTRLDLESMGKPWPTSIF